jgi:hypothetical protein
VEPSLHLHNYYRLGQVHAEEEIKDLALTFVEEEVGRFDWANNWLKLRRTTDVHKKIRTWLNHLNRLDNDFMVDAMVACLDKLVNENPGIWK